MDEAAPPRRPERRLLLLSDDEALVEALGGRLPPGWALSVAERLEAVGDWNDILLFRFVLLDLEARRLDPVQTVEMLRRDYLLDIPVAALGGSEGQRERLRPLGAACFAGRGDLGPVLRELVEKYGW